MLTASQKVTLLESAGIAVPAFPTRPASPVPQKLQGPQTSTEDDFKADAAYAEAVTQWKQEVESLHVGYAATRAARSLPELGNTR